MLNVKRSSLESTPKATGFINGVYNTYLMWKDIFQVKRIAEFGEIL